MKLIDLRLLLSFQMSWKKILLAVRKNTWLDCFWLVLKSLDSSTLRPCSQLVLEWDMLSNFILAQTLMWSLFDQHTQVIFHLYLLSSKPYNLRGWVEQISPFWWWQTKWLYWPFKWTWVDTITKAQVEEIFFTKLTYARSNLNKRDHFNFPPFGIIEKD